MKGEGPAAAQVSRKQEPNAQEAIPETRNCLFHFVLEQIPPNYGGILKMT